MYPVVEERHNVRGGAIWGASEAIIRKHTWEKEMGISKGTHAVSTLFSLLSAVELECAPAGGTLADARRLLLLDLAEECGVKALLR